MGGPTGEVHALDARSGGFGDKIQEVLFVPREELAGADKTRVALVRRHFSLYSPGLCFPVEIWISWH